MAPLIKNLDPRQEYWRPAVDDDRSREAIAPWKRSLETRPNERVRQYLAKAQRELAAEASFGQQESSHFTLRYEGKQTSDQLRRQIIMTLESEYDDLVRQLWREQNQRWPSGPRQDQRLPVSAGISR